MVLRQKCVLYQIVLYYECRRIKGVMEYNYSILWLSYSVCAFILNVFFRPLFFIQIPKNHVVTFHTMVLRCYRPMCVFLLVIIMHATMENQGLILITQTVRIITFHHIIFFIFFYFLQMLLFLIMNMNLHLHPNRCNPASSRYCQMCIFKYPTLSVYEIAPFTIPYSLH